MLVAWLGCHWGREFFLYFPYCPVRGLVGCIYKLHLLFLLTCSLLSLSTVRCILTAALVRLMGDEVRERVADPDSRRVFPQLENLQVDERAALM